MTDLPAITAELSKDVTPDDLERCARWAWELRQLLAAAKVALGDAEATLAELMPSKTCELPGLPAFERRQGADRKRWQSADLVSLLVRRGVDPDGTGEVTAEQMRMVDGVVRELTECAPFTGSMGWRVTALKERDIPVDEFCEVSPGRVSIQWHGEAG